MRLTRVRGVPLAGEALGFGDLDGAISALSHFRGSGLSPSLVEHEPHHLAAAVPGEDDRCARQLDLEGIRISPSRHADPLLTRCLQQESRVPSRHFQVDTRGHLVRSDIVWEPGVIPGRIDRQGSIFRCPHTTRRSRLA